MSDPRTIRIAIYQGGGTRGLLSWKFSELVFPGWGIDTEAIWKSFDVIAGTSSGGLQAAAYSYGVTFSIVGEFFKDVANRIFTSRSAPIGCDTDNDSNKLNLAQKVALILLNEPLYESPCLTSNFGHNILYQYIDAIFEDIKLSDLKTNTVIPVYQENLKKPVLFSNVDAPPLYVGLNEKVADVCKATSAAPIYLPPYSFGGNIYSDAGTGLNNVARSALNLARWKKPDANRACIAIFGTGLGEYGFHGSPTTEVESALSRYNNLFSIGSTIGQEIITQDLLFEQNFTVNGLQTHVYNFQPILDVLRDTELDSSDNDFDNYIESVAASTKAADQAAIDDFGGRLNL